MEDEKDRILSAYRAGLPPYPDGPILERFAAEELAQVIEHECIRTANLPNQKIDLRMDPQDALALARFLRYGRLG